jgi:hypothetical protein
MLSGTFIGQVHDGKLIIAQPLNEFEGKEVVVTLSVPDVPVQPANVPSRMPNVAASEEAEILEDLGRIQMPRRDVTTVKAFIVDVGRRPPRVYAEGE